MRHLSQSKINLENLNLKDRVSDFLPLALWGSLWLSVAPGQAGDILRPTAPVDFFNGFRYYLPFIAGAGAMAMILKRWDCNPSLRLLIFGPFSLAVLYGVVGLAASLLSPDGSTAIYWSAIYFSVPLVLLATFWMGDPLTQLQRLANLTWLGIIIVTAALFAIGLIYMDLGDTILHPSRFAKCEPIGHWFTQTGGVLRSTGVGRYAALTAVVSIAGLWHPRFGVLWGILLVGALMLLLTTGARTSIGGLMVAAPVIVLLYGGKKVAILGFAVVGTGIILHLAIGLDNRFVDQCLIRKGEPVVPHGLVATISSDAKGLEQEPSTNTQLPKTFAPNEVATVPTPTTGMSTVRTSGTRATEPASAEALQPDESQPLVESTSSPSENPVQPDESQPLVESTNSPSENPVQPNGYQPPALPPGDSPNSLLRNGSWASENQSKESDTVPDSTQLAVIHSLVQEPSALSRLKGLSGRTDVWKEAWQVFKEAPLAGQGFHADRLILGTHAHNAVIQAALQTGVLGTIPFVAAIVFGWLLALKGAIHLGELIGAHKRLFIQLAGILTFLTVRGVTESSGAYFGVDWLLLSLVLIYLQALNHSGMSAHSAP